MKLKSMFLQKCPKCDKGNMFSGVFAMNEHCPNCGLNFYPEHGYYLGAMMVSYIVSALVFVPFSWIVFHITDSLIKTILIILAVLIIFSPVAFRFSRSVFLHFDYWTEPRG